MRLTAPFAFTDLDLAPLSGGAFLVLPAAYPRYASVRLVGGAPKLGAIWSSVNLAGAVRPAWMALASLVVGIAACDDGASGADDAADVTRDQADSTEDIWEAFGALPGPSIQMDFTRADGFFAAPFPSAELFSDAGARVEQWPQGEIEFVAGLVDSASHLTGASQAGGIYFVFDTPPALAEGVSAATTDGPIRVRPLAADGRLGAATAVTIAYEADGGPFGAPSLLSALPVQGIPLAPDTLYVVTVSRSALGDASGGIGRTPELAKLLSHQPVAGLEGAARADYDRAVAALTEAGDDLDDLAALAVFRTADPVPGLDTFVAAALREPAPDFSGMTLTETFDRFCVFSATVDIPDYQSGNPPFNSAGEGVWQTNESAQPILQRHSPTRLVVTIPRAPPPANGYPTVVFIRTGGGGDRPLVDRGLRATHGGPPIVPTGTGPAMHISAAGWAAVSWDGPHGGPRNPSAGDEQFLMFNVLNPTATRDNVRQSALEAVLVESWLTNLSIDASDCPGVGGTATFDATTTAIMGHSMGGWIAPLALGRGGFDAAILSGAGGSWIENIVHKESPVAVRPVAELLLGYPAIGRTLRSHDPVLTLLQWVGDAADPQLYGAHPPEGARGARGTHVLMIEGVVDTYILPPIANATALSLALDLAEPAAADADPRLSEYVPLGALLTFVGRAKVPLPATSNDGLHTRVVVQSPGDAIEDGHEAMFQTAAPKFQYRCYLADIAAGRTPTIRPGNAISDEWTACEHHQ